MSQEEVDGICRTIAENCAENNKIASVVMIVMDGPGESYLGSARLLPNRMLPMAKALREAADKIELAAKPGATPGRN